ncbi:MAG: DegT/DnrJ/EryC1/StrS family aminotransferase, partial [Smithella sp.]
IIREKGTNRSEFFRGQTDKYTWVDIGSSYLSGDIIAAFLYAQMENADKIVAKRNLIYSLYMKNLMPLAEKGCFRLPCILNNCSINGHIFHIMTSSLKERMDLALFLRKKGIMAVFHYVPLHSSPAGQLYGRVCGKMEVTDMVSDCLLRLPVYYEMTEEDVHIVTESINDFYKRF